MTLPPTCAIANSPHYANLKHSGMKIRCELPEDHDSYCMVVTDHCMDAKRRHRLLNIKPQFKEVAK
jgi:hypothetical protein